MRKNNLLIVSAIISIVLFTKISNANEHSQYSNPAQKMMEEFWNDSFFHPNSSRISRHFSNLKVDMVVNESDMVLHIDLPGMEKDKIKIVLNEEYVTISGKRENSIKKEDKKKNNFYYSEKSYGEFKRIISLPAKAKIDAATTSYKNGVLQIIIPKAAKDKSKERELIV